MSFSISPRPKCPKTFLKETVSNIKVCLGLKVLNGLKVFKIMRVLFCIFLLLALRQQWQNSQNKLFVLYQIFIILLQPVHWKWLRKMKPDSKVTPHLCLPLKPSVLREQSQGWCLEFMTSETSVGNIVAPWSLVAFPDDSPKIFSAAL